MKVWGKQQKDLTQRKIVLQKMDRKRTFRKNFLKISVSMLLVVLVGYGFVYGIVKGVIIDQNIQISLLAFSQVQTQFDEANQTANTIATQVVLDDICSEFLNTGSRQMMNSIYLTRVRNQLSLYQNTNPSVDSIYVYNRMADLIICSGSRYGAVGLDDFSDTSIVGILKEPDIWCRKGLIPREAISRYPNRTEKRETVYSFIMFNPQDSQGNIVVVNMKLDNMIREILQMESMKDSIMVVLDENQECLVERTTMGLEKTDSLMKKVNEKISEKKRYREFNDGGENYSILYLSSVQSQWGYVKLTKWNTLFHILTGLRNKILVFSAVGVVAVFITSLWISLSIARLHRVLEMKYAQILQGERTDMQTLKERFLLDFIHNRKVFSRQSLKMEMEKFGFPVSDEQKFTLVILTLENYEKYQDTFGKKGTYDIKYGFANIFEETFGEQFRIMGLINRDETMAFILEIQEDGLNQIGTCFQKFCQNVSVFVPWDFMLFGIGIAENVERIPEMNSQLQAVIAEGFFYPTNTYVTYEEIQEQHHQNVEFQKLDVGAVAKSLNSGVDITETYMEMSESLKVCSVSEYMNAMTWLGITIVRNARKYTLSEKVGNEFFMQLTQCKKAAEVDEVFINLFENIMRNQSKAPVKKGVTGKLDEVKLYIEHNFRDANITLEKLGDEFGVSPNYLGRLFKKDTGISVADYINSERLKWVLAELENTDRPAKEIAEECGFVSTNYFYTYFRKKIGVTPQAYREQIHSCSVTEKII